MWLDQIQTYVLERQNLNLKSNTQKKEYIQSLEKYYQNLNQLLG